MRAQDTLMFTEAASAAEVVLNQLAANRPMAEALGQRLRDKPPTAVLITGRGSSDNAGVYARYLIETRTGVLVSAAAPSVSSVYAKTPLLEGAVCIAISQSGKSPDLVASVEAAKAGGAYVVALVNVEDSPLARVADAVLPLRAGPEKSVAATKTFIASLSAAAQLVACWLQDAELLAALDALPDQMEAAWDTDWSEALGELVAATDLYVVGRGLGYGVAREASLKFKETAGLHAEAFSAAEVRHGPMALVKSGFPVMMLSQDDDTREDIVALADDFAARGAKVVLAGGQAARSVTVLPTVSAKAELEPILLIQSFYKLAAQVSVARGYDPDRPPYLNKVTDTV